MMPVFAWLRTQATPAALVMWLPIAVVVGAGAFVSYRLNMNLRADRDLVVHSHRVIEAGQRLLIAAADAETGQRGYLVTGDKSYLEPYDQGRQAATDAIVALAGRVSDNAAQRDRVARLGALMREKNLELGEAIAARDASGFAAARDIVTANRGKAVMDEVRSTLGALNLAEDEILLTREAAVERAETRVVLAGIFVGLASILTRIALAWTTSRGRSARLE